MLYLDVNAYETSDEAMNMISYEGYAWKAAGNKYTPFYTSENGGGGSHNNMPAYQTLYAWRRTA